MGERWQTKWNAFLVSVAGTPFDGFSVLFWFGRYLVVVQNARLGKGASSCFKTVEVLSVCFLYDLFGIVRRMCAGATCGAKVKAVQVEACQICW